MKTERELVKLLVFMGIDHTKGFGGCVDRPDQEEITILKILHENKVIEMQKVEEGFCYSEIMYALTDYGIRLSLNNIDLILNVEADDIATEKALVDLLIKLKIDNTYRLRGCMFLACGDEDEGAMLKVLHENKVLEKMEIEDASGKSTLYSLTPYGGKLVNDNIDLFYSGETSV